MAEPKITIYAPDSAETLSYKKLFSGLPPLDPEYYRRFGFDKKPADKKTCKHHFTYHRKANYFECDHCGELRPGPGKKRTPKRLP